LILAAAVVGCLLFLGIQQWVGPAVSESGKFAAETLRDREALTTLGSQLAALEAQVSSPNAALQASLARLKLSYSNQEPQIQAAQKNLVMAKDMSLFLQSLLAGNKGLQLLSLETLAPEPLVNPADKTKVVETGVNLYKHGVKLRLSGTYRELMAYLADIEQSPQRVLWGDMKISVSNHPQVILTLTVYTLSLDKAWMTL
jgi:MSHA biogenesis protein MshJ